MIPPQAILCDMDGTLVDTEPYWEDAKVGLAARYGIPFSAEQVAALVGRSMMITVQAMQDAGVPLDDEAILAALVDEVAARVADGIPWLPGAQAFLARIAVAGIPVALVTQAWRPVAEQIVQASGGAISVLVSGGDVAHPKPHPEPYLLAAERLGVDASRCVAIEDSPSGVASAEAAGAQVMVLPGVHPVDSGARRHPVESLDAIDLAMLARLLSHQGPAQ